MSKTLTAIIPTVIILGTITQPAVAAAQTPSEHVQQLVEDFTHNTLQNNPNITIHHTDVTATDTRGNQHHVTLPVAVPQEVHHAINTAALPGVQFDSKHRVEEYSAASTVQAPNTVVVDNPSLPTGVSNEVDPGSGGRVAMVDHKTIVDGVVTDHERFNHVYDQGSDRVVEASPHQPQAQPSAPEQPTQPQVATPVSNNTVWDSLAQCESGGNWSINTGNGYHGGLQFSPTSWIGAGGGKYAQYAHLATREQQIEIAENLKAMQGWGAWPACSSKLGLR